MDLVLKTIFNCRMMQWLVLVWGICLPPLCAWGQSPDLDRTVQRVAQVVDYVAADYSGAVSGGAVIDAGEYDEQRALLAAAQQLLPTLSARSSQGLSVLTQELAGVVTAVDGKQSPEVVLAACRAVRKTLQTQFQLHMVPSAAVDASRGQALYLAQCATCHGADGKADTPVAKTLKPPPVSFLDGERMGKVAPALAFHTLTFGIPGTGMVAFDALSAADRWSLAFYVVALRHGRPGVEQAPPALASGALSELSTLAVLAELSDGELDEALRKSALPTDAPARLRVIDHLRTWVPFARPSGSVDRFAVANALLTDALAAAQTGDFAAAHRLGISSYLDGIEPHEAALRIDQPALVHTIEAAYAALRKATDPSGAPSLANARLAADEIRATLRRADADRSGAARSGTKSFLASLLIALREGLEVALLIAALLAFLRKSGQAQLARSVHLGWITSIPAGLLTFVLLGAVIDGARRELAEGLITLFAAAVLIFVTHWILGAREAKHWLGFLRKKIEAAGAQTGHRQSLALFGIAFFAAYREALETVLFYRALLLDAGQAGYRSVLAGLGLGVVLLVGVVVLVGKIGRRLNPRPVMLGSSLLLALLSISLTGHGVHALQEGGYLRISQVLLGTTPASGFPSLGLYPSWESLSAQVLVVVLLMLPPLIERFRAVRSGSPPSAAPTRP